MPAAVASHSAHPSAGPADRGVSAPSGLTVGDLCLVIANTDGAGGDLDLSGAGTWTKLAAAPAAVPGVHVFAATDVAAADGPWTLTGASGEWVHRMSVRITDPGDVSVGGHFNGTPGSTAPNWDAAIIPTTDAPADDTLSIIAAYVMGTNDSVPSSTLIANPSGALAARWRLVDEGPTGTTSWSPANVWAVVTAARILVAPAGGGDHRTTSGSLALTLATGGAGSKSAGVVGSVDLGIGTASPGAAKEGHTDGSVGADLDVVALGVKSAPVAGEVDIAVAVTAAAITDRAAEGTVNVDVAVVGDTSKASLAASALNLALDLAADTEKAAAVAGSLGIILDITGTGQAHSPGETDGHLALALAAVAVAVKAAQTAGHPGVIFDLTGTAEKHATTSGALAVALDTVGATVPDEDDVTGLVTLGLSVTGTASKQTGTVGTVALVVALAGRARRLGISLPPARSAAGITTRATANTTTRAAADITTRSTADTYGATR